MTADIVLRRQKLRSWRSDGVVELQRKLDSWGSVTELEVEVASVALEPKSQSSSHKSSHTPLATTTGTKTRDSSQFALVPLRYLVYLLITILSKHAPRYHDSLCDA
jgi:hypothetical protein